MPVHTFKELGLAEELADSELWHFCQARQIILITANRNDEGPDSLEATIRNHNTPESWPVFTLADSEQVHKNKMYANRVAERLLQYLLEIDQLRGTGRIYIP